METSRIREAAKLRTVNKILALWLEKLDEAEETVQDLVDDLAADLGICVENDTDALVEDYGYAEGTEELAEALVRNAKDLEDLEAEILRRTRLALELVIQWPRDGDDDPVGVWDRDQTRWMEQSDGN